MVAFFGTAAPTGAGQLRIGLPVGCHISLWKDWAVIYCTSLKHASRIMQEVGGGVTRLLPIMDSWVQIAPYLQHIAVKNLLDGIHSLWTEGMLGVQACLSTSAISPALPREQAVPANAAAEPQPLVKSR